MERDITELLVKAQEILKEESEKFDINKSGEDDALIQLLKIDRYLSRTIDTIYTYNQNKNKGYYKH